MLSKILKKFAISEHGLGEDEIRACQLSSDWHVTFLNSSVWTKDDPQWIEFIAHSPYVFPSSARSVQKLDVSVDHHWYDVALFARQIYLSGGVQTFSHIC
jgi:hypothetical protein